MLKLVTFTLMALGAVSAAGADQWTENPFEACAQILGQGSSLKALEQVHSSQASVSYFSDFEVVLHSWAYDPQRSLKEAVGIDASPLADILSRARQTDVRIAAEDYVHLRQTVLALSAEAAFVGSRELRALGRQFLNVAPDIDEDGRYILSRDLLEILKRIHPVFEIERRGLNFERRFALHRARLELNGLMGGTDALPPLAHAIHFKEPVTREEWLWIADRVAEWVEHWDLPGPDRRRLYVEFKDFMKKVRSAQGSLPSVNSSLRWLLLAELPDFVWLNPSSSEAAERVAQALRFIADPKRRESYEDFLVGFADGRLSPLTRSDQEHLATLVEFYTRGYLVAGSDLLTKDRVEAHRANALRKLNAGAPLTRDEAFFVLISIPHFAGDPGTNFPNQIGF